MKKFLLLLLCIPIISNAQFVMQGICTQSGGTFILNGISQTPYAGRVFNTTAFNLNSDFDLSFNTVLGNSFNNGFVFLFYAGAVPTTTFPSTIISTDNIQNFGTGSIATDFVVEFDMRGSFCAAGQNTAYEPTTDINHISYWRNNSACTFGNYYSPYSPFTPIDYITPYPCRIKWTKSSNTLETYYNNTLIKSNVIDLVGLMGTSVYWGFSAGCYCVTGAPAVSNIILNGTVLLPLDLTSFSAEKNNNTVKLIWQTAMENNTAYFDIEKSNDGRTFYSFQKVMAAGFSNSIKNYTTTDISPLYGNGYYRLKMVDKDGRINYSNIVVVKMYDKTGGVNIFPNPVQNELQLQIPSDKKEMVTIQIEDAAGKILQTRTLELNAATIYTSLNTSLLVPGMYLLNVKRGDRQEVKKFIKQ